MTLYKHDACSNHAFEVVTKGEHGIVWGGYWWNLTGKPSRLIPDMFAVHNPDEWKPFHIEVEE